MLTNCIDCGQDNYGKGLFLWLPTHQWLQLGYAEEDYACASCILKRAENLEAMGEIFKFCTLVLDVGKASFIHKNYVPIPPKTIRESLNQS